MNVSDDLHYSEGFTACLKIYMALIKRFTGGSQILAVKNVYCDGGQYSVNGGLWQQILTDLNKLFWNKLNVTLS